MIGVAIAIAIAIAIGIGVEMGRDAKWILMGVREM